MLSLSKAIRFNRSLVKLDLSRNALKYSTTKYLMEALVDNVTLVQIDLSGNFLCDKFAVQLAHLLTENQTLFKVDIASNPIGPFGAEKILDSLKMQNDSLGDLGDLSTNMYMGVRIRELLKQIIFLNHSSHDKKKALITEQKQQTGKNFVSEKDGDIIPDSEKVESAKPKQKQTTTVTQQLQYPLLRPVTFTNVIEDDYLSSGLWSLDEDQ